MGLKASSWEEMVMMHNPVPWMLVNGEPTVPRAMNALFSQLDLALSPSFPLHYLDHLGVDLSKSEEGTSLICWKI